MCGITGYAGPNGNIEALHRMTDVVSRRGPDDEGFFVEGNVGFGFRRLSIIDLNGGHQPVSNEDGTVWAMLNGEIYGFNGLRDELLRLGHAFSTKSDTEVIVHAYEQFGDSCFEHLEGMFAVAIWDSQRKRLVLARDRMGKKPLYWTENGDTLWFASELKSLLAARAIKREIDPVSLALYFRTDCIPTPKTIFKNVHKLEPASALSWEGGRVKRSWCFWTPKNQISFEPKDPKRVIQNLRALIDEAVAKRLISDVPLGLFLSGGVDSAVVAESAARQGGRMQAFTIGFDDPTHDESGLSRLTAKTLGLDHHVEIFKESDALSMVDEAVHLLDEPLADASILPMLLLSKFTRRNVTVALSGDGGDELLLGYQHIGSHGFLNALPDNISKQLKYMSPILDAIPARDGYFSLGFKSQRMARGLGVTNPWKRDVLWRGAMTDKDLKSLLLPEVESVAMVNYAEIQLNDRAAEIADGDFWRQWTWAYMRTFLMDEVMVKVDRATMWFSLEARAPLLDVRVVEFLMNLPTSMKLGAWKEKRVFKELLKDRVPNKVLNGKKHGFAIPVGKWLNSKLSAKLDELLESSVIKNQNLFDSVYVANLVKEHRSGKKDRRKELWALFMFQNWYLNFFEKN